MNEHQVQSAISLSFPETALYDSVDFRHRLVMWPRTFTEMEVDFIGFGQVEHRTILRPIANASLEHTHDQLPFKHQVSFEYIHRPPALHLYPASFRLTPRPR